MEVRLLKKSWQPLVYSIKKQKFSKKKNNNVDLKVLHKSRIHTSQSSQFCGKLRHVMVVLANVAASLKQRKGIGCTEICKFTFTFKKTVTGRENMLAVIIKISVMLWIVANNFSVRLIPEGQIRLSKSLCCQVRMNK